MCDNSPVVIFQDVDSVKVTVTHRAYLSHTVGMAAISTYLSRVNLESWAVCNCVAFMRFPGAEFRKAIMTNFRNRRINSIIENPYDVVASVGEAWRSSVHADAMSKLSPQSYQHYTMVLCKLCNGGNRPTSHAVAARLYEIFTV